MSIAYINRKPQNNCFGLNRSIILYLRLYFSCHLENSGHLEKLHDVPIANFYQWVEPYIFWKFGALITKCKIRPNFVTNLLDYMEQLCLEYTGIPMSDHSFHQYSLPSPTPPFTQPLPTPSLTSLPPGCLLSRSTSEPRDVVSLWRHKSVTWCPSVPSQWTMYGPRWEITYAYSGLSVLVYHAGTRMNGRDIKCPQRPCFTMEAPLFQDLHGYGTGRGQWKGMAIAAVLPDIEHVEWKVIFASLYWFSIS